MPSDTSATPMLAHMVYFSLKEPTPENRQKMLAACHKYLTDHPGQVLYAAGTCASYDRPVNDRDFDIALHLVFKNKEAHDKYQVSDKHKQFITENLSGVKRVRVFDSKVNDAKIAKP